MSENINQNVQTEDINTLMKVRMDKLDELRQEGKDPFKITKFQRTHLSSQIKDNYTVEDRELKKRVSEEVEIIKAHVSAFDGQ